MAQYTPEYQPTGDEVAVITTSKGTVRVQLAGKDAPIHVGNFVELARKGFYDGLKFHRHVPGFVIQGGCPNTRDLTPEEVVKKAGNPFAGLGTGGPGYTIKGEFSDNGFENDLKHTRGVISMARSQSYDSAGSQFFIMHEDAPHLDGQYAARSPMTPAWKPWTKSPPPPPMPATVRWSSKKSSPSPWTPRVMNARFPRLNPDR